MENNKTYSIQTLNLNFGNNTELCIFYCVKLSISLNGKKKNMCYTVSLSFVFTKTNKTTEAK